MTKRNPTPFLFPKTPRPALGPLATHPERSPLRAIAASVAAGANLLATMAVSAAPLGRWGAPMLGLSAAVLTGGAVRAWLRRRRVLWLLSEGAVSLGEVTAVRRRSLRYQFRGFGGVRHRGRAPLTAPARRGDPIAVLYAPHRPGSNTAVQGVDVRAL